MVEARVSPDVSTTSTLEFKHVKFQYLAVCCVNIISLCHGCGIGWMSPAISVLKSDDTPLMGGPITDEEISWIGAFFSIGALIGNVMYAVLLPFIGLRWTMICLAFPNIGFWLCVIFARNPIHLYIGRLLTGVTGGGIYICLPMFVSEIADPRVRGKLGSFLMMILSGGILAAFVAGTYLPYHIVPFLFIVLPIVYIMCFIFFPETVQQNLKNGNEENAAKAYMFYRFGNEVNDENTRKVSQELEDLQMYLKLRKEEDAKRNIWTILFTCVAVKGILTGICLTFLNLFSGTLAMLSYTTLIFKMSGSTVDPDISAIVVATLQVVSVYISCLLVDRVGRKSLLIASSSGAAVACAALATFSYLHEQNVDLTRFNWIPLAFFSFYVFITCMGILPLPFIILSEILPAEARQVGSTICMISLSVFAFITLKAFPVVSDSYGLYTTLYICSGVCVFGLLFAIFILRETKGKNLHTIEKK